MSEKQNPDGLERGRDGGRHRRSGYTLRYYERAGLIQAVTRTGGNQRRYQPGDVEWVRFLRLRETGMPISQMHQYADLRAEGEARPSPARTPRRPP